MHVGVGYSDNPDTAKAGKEAARAAVARAGRNDPCDLVILLGTSRHNLDSLRHAVVRVVGDKARIVGGGAVGAITNRRYGYAGDQVGLAAIWFERGGCEIFVESGINAGEEGAGQRLGRKMREQEVPPESPLVMFYDAINKKNGEVKLNLATHLLRGLEQGYGSLPSSMAGAGLQGDYVLSPMPQLTGEGTQSQTALALSFSGPVRMDTVIMHGCRPATGYYTVTKADGPTILEIDHQPAIQRLNSVLGSGIPPSAYPFFLILGVNTGDKWEPFHEENYASRLCLGLDEERGGIIMFEADMVAGTEFQVMYRSLDLDYMEPRLEAAFASLNGRKPVFGLYIDCAGRAAGYGGAEQEDALVVQRVVRDRVPLLGMYSGVEIAPVKGRPRGLDWTGVFCLFSVPQ